MVAQPPQPAARGLSEAPVLQRWPALAGASVPLAAHEPCGDAFGWWPLRGGAAHEGLLAIVDGLGHGADAALAAQRAISTLDSLQAAADQPPLQQLMLQLDSALAAPLRGAAVGLLRVQGSGLQHLGVGNTRALRWRAGQVLRLPSCNGVVGGGLPGELPLNRLDLAAQDWLLLFTDGLDERLELPLLLPEWQRDPALLCLHLLQRHSRGLDDAAALVMPVQPGG